MTTISKPENRHWTGVQKAVFRFFFIFFTLYVVFLNTTDVFPFLNLFITYYSKPFEQFVIWIGIHILKLNKPISVLVTGSGDTTYDYVSLLLVFVVAVTGSLTWTLTDRKKRNYDKLFYWLCTVLRYYLAFTMLSYGFSKVIKLQFPAASPSTLIQSVGSKSPMGLAWLYMGYSTGFNYFTGLAEVLGGLLLFSRRTTVIGALFIVVITGNIMAINFCFDVPVKLFSTGLTVIAIFLLAENARPLIDLFFLKKTVTLSVSEPPRFNSRRKNIALKSVKYILIAYAFVNYIHINLGYKKKFGDDVDKPLFYGIHNTESFIRNNDTIAPLITDSTRWRRFIVNRRNSQIIFMNDSAKSYKSVTDTTKHTITLKPFADSTKKYVLSYTEVKNGDLQLKGKWGSDSLTINLKNYSLDHFILINRGFHWINETPFHR